MKASNARPARAAGRALACALACRVAGARAGSAPHRGAGAARDWLALARRATTCGEPTRRRRKRFREGDVRGASGPGRASRGRAAVRRGASSARCIGTQSPPDTPGSPDGRLRGRRVPHGVRRSAPTAPRRHARARGRRQVAGGRLLDALMRRVPAPERDRRRSRKFACPACGGEAIWNPAKQKLVCPFCGTESPAKLDDGTGDDRRARSRRGAARHRRRGARLEGGQAQVKCQSCNAISVFDPEAAGAELRVLRLGAARPVRGDEARVPPGERAAVRDQRAERARPHPPVVRQAVARAQRAQAPRADRHGEGHLPAVLDVRRAGATRSGPRKRATTTTRRRRTPRAARRARGRCGTCAGSRPPARCRTSSTTTSCARRSACIPACCAGSSRFPRRR